MMRQVAVAVAVGSSLLIASAPAWAADTSGSSGSSAGPATVGSNTVTSTTGTATVGSNTVTSSTGTATELPRTGSDIVGPGLAAGLGLLMAGAGMVVVSRRHPAG